MHYSLDRLTPRAPVPGFNGRFIHSENMTFAWWTIDAGAEIPRHAHPHEQVVNVLEGRLELVVGDETHLLGPGEVVVIPGEIPHSARGITECRVLDVFAPMREDYRVLSDAEG